LNISKNITDWAQSPAPGKVSYLEVLNGFCEQISGKVLLAATLILLYFLFYTVILPRINEAWKEYLTPTGYRWLYDDYIKKGYDYLMSFIETLGMGSAVFLIALFWGRWPWYTWTVAIIGAVFIGAYLVSFIIGWLRRRL